MPENVAMHPQKVLKKKTGKNVNMDINSAGFKTSKKKIRFAIHIWRHLSIFQGRHYHLTNCYHRTQAPYLGDMLTTNSPCQLSKFHPLTKMQWVKNSYKWTLSLGFFVEVLKIFYKERKAFTTFRPEGCPQFFLLRNTAYKHTCVRLQENSTGEI